MHGYRNLTVPGKSLSRLIEAMRADLPELPAARRRRFAETLKLPADDAEVLTVTRALADYYEPVVKRMVMPRLRRPG